MLFVFDFESHLIKPGACAPRPVCMSYAFVDEISTSSLQPFSGGWRDVGKLSQSNTSLVPWQAGIEALAHALRSGAHIVAHNLAFDILVAMEWCREIAPLVFEAGKQGRLHCTLIREKLLVLERNSLDFDVVTQQPPRYSLAALVEKYLKVDISETKTDPDAWRLRYSELDGVPLETWPEGARSYAILDTVYAAHVWKCQQVEAMRRSYVTDEFTVVDESRQVNKSVALALQSAWGFVTDGDKVSVEAAGWKAQVQALVAGLFSSGLTRLTSGDPGYTKDAKALQARVKAWFDSQQIPVPLTDSGTVSTERDVLLATSDPVLHARGQLTAFEKVISTYLPILERGAKEPIHTRYDAVKETGRTSSIDPNVQNMPRKFAVRECIVPRPGTVFVSVDYDTLELRSWAQACLYLVGFSRMAEALREGVDPHLKLGAQLLGMEYAEAVRLKREPEVKRARQIAKVANFGFPGGLGAESFIAYCAGYTEGDIVLTLEEAKKLRAGWMEEWAEARPFFAAVTKMQGGHGSRFPLTQIGSGRRRGSVTFPSGCNSFFQGLAADGASDALFAVSEECYAVPDSPLFGSRPILFIHDEIIMESPVDRFSAAGKRLASLMCECMQIVIPDVPITASPAAMERWYKNAEPVWDEQGNLLIWRPKDAP